MGASRSSPVDRGIFRRVIIGGNLQTKQNDGRQVAVGNRIDADLQAFSNEGGVRILDNVIDGNLQAQVQLAATHRREQRGPGEQGRPVPQPLSERGRAAPPSPPSR